MKKILSALSVCSVVFFSCASGAGGLRSAHEIVDLSSISAEEKVTRENAENILKKYIIDFEIPNPLYSESDGNSRRRRKDPSHEPTINCRAVLLDDFSTEAHILFQCQADSLDDVQCEEFREDYYKKNLRESMFRILISMESGFSEKSMELEHWALYIENSEGVMIEPADIKTSKVTTVEDSVYSEYYKTSFHRRFLKRDITLYFKTRTFFGQYILSSENPFIMFVMSRKKKTLARVAWKISKADK